MAIDPTGLVIIRAWIEQGSPEPLRAEVRIVSDLAAGLERKLTFSRPELVCGAVQTWLDDLLRDAVSPD